MTVPNAGQDTEQWKLSPTVFGSEKRPYDTVTVLPNAGPEELKHYIHTEPSHGCLWLLYS